VEVVEPKANFIVPADPKGLAGDRVDLDVEVRKDEPVPLQQALVPHEVSHRGGPPPTWVVPHRLVRREVPCGQAADDPIGVGVSEQPAVLLPVGGEVPALDSRAPLPHPASVSRGQVRENWTRRGQESEKWTT
jgi:hypothetical protein